MGLKRKLMGLIRELLYTGSPTNLYKYLILKGLVEGNCPKYMGTPLVLPL